MKYKKTILLDLDGVLNTYTGGFDPDVIPPIRENAEKFLKALMEKYDLKLFTTRPMFLVKKWCDENNVSQFFSEITNEKKTAWLIIDDRCLCFNGNYEDTLVKIESFKPWYK